MPCRCRRSRSMDPLWADRRDAARGRRHAVHGRRRSPGARALRGPDRGRDAGRAADAATVPPMLEAATLAAEDRRFYSHPGVDAVSLLRAVKANLSEGRIVEGGSTISQQVAKLLIQRKEGVRPRGWRAKAREMVLALRLEHRLGKREMLALYLNLASYGNQTAGAARASRLYFGVEPSMLTPAQAAFLAALPQRPTAFNPWKGLASARVRQQAVLRRMGAAGCVDRRSAARGARGADRPAPATRAVRSAALRRDGLHLRSLRELRWTSATGAGRPHRHHARPRSAARSRGHHRAPASVARIARRRQRRRRRARQSARRMAGVGRLR